MAVYRSLIRSYKINLLQLQCCTIPINRKCFSDSDSSRQIFVEVDVMDEFTTQLMQSKSEKWAKQAVKNNIISKHSKYPHIAEKYDKLSPEIYSSTQEINAQFDHYFQNEDYNSVLRLIKGCIHYKKCPQFLILNKILTYCSENGEKEIIIQLRDLYQEVQPSVLEISGKGYFSFFLAVAIWMTGDVLKSITLFKEVYEGNAYLRKRIRLSLRNLITDIVTCRSDVALQNIIEFSEYLAEEFNDFYPLRCIWQNCFLSEWFSDQILAINLLERNKTLCDHTSNRISYVIAISLKNDRIEVVHMLLEFLLKNNRKTETTGLILMLFDYHLKHNNLSSCSTILQWCRDNNVSIPGVQNKFAKLLLKDYVMEAENNKKDKDCVEYYFKF